MDFPSPSLKDSLYFDRELTRPKNQKFLILFLIAKKNSQN